MTLHRPPPRGEARARLQLAIAFALALWGLALGGAPTVAAAAPPQVSPAPPAPAAVPAYLGGLAAETWTGPIPTLSDPTQSWELYLPRGYSSARKWPVLIVFDPRSRGRFAGELFREAADELGWVIASSNDTTSDGPAGPNARAINAMIPDVMKRLPIDDRRIYATGFSGGAVLAWTVGLKGGYLAGVISVGGRPAPEHLALVPKFALFSTAGEADFNYQPTRELDEIAARAGVPHRLELFPGPHAWCPPATARAAVLWLEILAMRDGRAPRDAARIESALAGELAGAEALATTGDALAAGRRFAMIAETFSGLADEATVHPAALRAGELLASAAAKSSVKEEKAAKKYEEQVLTRISEAAARLRAAETPVPSGELRHLLGVDEALRRREGGGIAGAAAARALAAIHVQLGVYLTQELLAAKDFRRAVSALELVAGIFPESPALRYNLACAQARAGLPEPALASLAAAFESGLPQPMQISSDADLASLRDRPEFARLLERARELAAAPAQPAPN